MRSFLAVLFLLSTLNVSAFAADVRLSVAASMTDAARDLIAAYEKSSDDASVLANFAASGALARQIAQGAPADVFISAHPSWMHHLVEAGKVPAATVRPLARNCLVFVGRKELQVAILPDIVRLERIALGSPQSVPAGRYAVQALRNAGLHERVREKLVMAKDVRQALVYAERGAADGAFVYRTDARQGRQVVVLFEVPGDLHDEVVYPVALTAAGTDNPAALAFYEFLSTTGAGQILQKHGFGLPDGSAAGGSP